MIFCTTFPQITCLILHERILIKLLIPPMKKTIVSNLLYQICHQKSFLHNPPKTLCSNTDALNAVSKSMLFIFYLTFCRQRDYKKDLKLTDHKPGLDKTSPWKKLSKSPCQLPLAKRKRKKKLTSPLLLPSIMILLVAMTVKRTLYLIPKGATEGYNFIWVSSWWNFFFLFCVCSCLSPFYPSRWRKKPYFRLKIDRVEMETVRAY